jgi:hypothetical protein
MKNKELAMEQVLALLKDHPELVGALVFEPTRITRLLKNKAARRLALGVDVKEFLKDIISTTDGGPLAICRHRTMILSAAKCPRTTRTPGAAAAERSRRRTR